MSEKKLKVLVVDDEKIIRDFFRRLLLLRGMEVEEAEDGFKAIARIKEESFDLCFLDVKMPGMNGLETYREIRRINQQIPVVMMTGYAVEDLLEQARKEGVTVQIRKPFEINQVNTILQEVNKNRLAAKPNLLIIDDDENVLSFFANLLKQKGYSFALARNAEEVNKVSKEKKFDLIFLDLVLKNTNGLELYQKLKEAFPKAEIVIITGYLEKGEEAKKTLGIQGCLYKPFEMEKILDLLKEVETKK